MTLKSHSEPQLSTTQNRPQILQYAYRNVAASDINSQLMAFMQRLADAIGARDPLFECRVVPVGSAYEGTKVGYTDEFDMNFVLTRFSSLYEVVTSPASPVWILRI